MTGRELKNVTCKFFTFPKHGIDIGWGPNMDAISITNIQEIHDTKTLVSRTAIILTGRQQGTWDFTTTITEPASSNPQTATWELFFAEDDKCPTRYVHRLPPAMHDIKTFVFHQLGTRATEMDNLPLRMRHDIESHLTNMGLEADVLIKMSKTMHTCIVGQQTGSWIGRIVHKWHANLQQHVPGKLTSFDTMPTGKYSGQTVDDIWQVDQQYVWFLSQRSLNHVQCLRYKDFFDSCPAVVQRAKELTEGLSMPEVRQEQTSSSTFKPGGWRGW
jgi:hypothetical protein